MTRQFIKRILLFLCMAVLVFTTQTKAQDPDNNHFIYIQAKAKQPFYVILNKKVYSSSSIGYLIIPKLKDGSYDLRIGFPQAQTPEQNFTCVVKGADAGYSLQQGDNGNLGLLNLQSKEFIASSSQTTIEDQYDVASAKADDAVKDVNSKAADTKAKAADAASNNAFSAMLSDAANDPTLALPKETPKATLANKEEKTSTQVEDFGNNPVEDSKAIAQAVPEEHLKPAENSASDLSKTYGVIKAGQQRTKKGTSMTFVMFNSRSTDTVDILVPPTAETADEQKTTGVAPTPISKKESLALFANTEEDSFNVEGASAAAAARKEARKKKREEKRFVDLGNSDQQNQDAEVKGAVNNPFYDKSTADDTGTESATGSQRKKQRADADVERPAEDQAQTAAGSVQCDPISEKDFQKMQKKMIARNNDNDMIAIVDKYIDGKCVTTSQVKTLGGLFLSDAGRYALFHDTYSHVSDKQNFPSLESQLLDSYFKKRFQQILQ
ncbi:protein of unknown function [Arachidicoccus rhizosphaerae]|uniref:DUF4476 domain-containing protein n=1 Tax=Arachidicoccus rhizosphaerae TaxID=551991 RepID=A0A1H3ZFL6_9BACT|nr:DUF4476 domain-containing protein [Arachidicoccus rhizosphaerae]SEA22447.1 protein of unknown function [Arachidicoccus rhizosphaerae]